MSCDEDDDSDDDDDDYGSAYYSIYGAGMPHTHYLMAVKDNYISSTY